MDYNKTTREIFRLCVRHFKHLDGLKNTTFQIEKRDVEACGDVSGEQFVLFFKDKTNYVVSYTVGYDEDDKEEFCIWSCYDYHTFDDVEPEIILNKLKKLLK